MNAEFVVQGTLRPDGIVELDQKPALPPGRVQLVLVPLPDLPEDDPFWQRMRARWAAQQARGHIPRSVETVEAERRRLRDESEAELEENVRIHQEGRRHAPPPDPSEDVGR